MSYKERNCRTCGKLCYGRHCKECYKKHGTPLTMRYAIKRKKEMMKIGKK